MSGGVGHFCGEGIRACERGRPRDDAAGGLQQNSGWQGPTCETPLVRGCATGRGERGSIGRVDIGPSGSAEFAIANAAWGVTVTVTAAYELALAVLVAVMMTEVLLVTLGA